MKYTTRDPAMLRASQPAFAESLAGKPPETYVIPLCDPIRDAVPYFSFIEVLRPGSTIHAHAHAQAYETFYVLRGRGVVEVEGEQFEMVQGGSYTVAPPHRHALWNPYAERLYLHILLVPDEGFAEAIYAGPELALDAEDLLVLRGPQLAPP